MCSIINNPCNESSEAKKVEIMSGNKIDSSLYLPRLDIKPYYRKLIIRWMVSKPASCLNALCGYISTNTFN